MPLNSLVNLKAMIGIQRAMIITNRKPAGNNHQVISDDLSAFFLSDNLIRRYDVREKARLSMALEKSNCTQLIFLGVSDESTKSALLFSSSLHSVRAGLQFKTPLLPDDSKVINFQFRTRALLEQYVIMQCRHLMEFHFINEKVAKGQLDVRGIVGTAKGDDLTTVFTNGVWHNDFVTVN
ncbi:hypothetical protein WBG78_19590 [Chryseolinea sp. T2]|uniref:hypothetical protein n=1 Tax=Chryseolinea sp. T2 TaxID=3129255 RepID=UPI003077423E